MESKSLDIRYACIHGFYWMICCAMIGMEVEITAMQTANVLMKFLMACCSFYLKI